MSSDEIKQKLQTRLKQNTLQKCENKKTRVNSLKSRGIYSTLGEVHSLFSLISSPNGV